MMQSNARSDMPSIGRWLGLIGVLVGLLGVAVIALLAVITGLPLGALMGEIFNFVFAASSVQALWYVTRAAGIIAYLLLWLATAYGLAVASKILEPVLQGTFTYDFHEFLSLLSIGFVVLHVVVLLADRYLPFSVASVLIPFVAPYRPVWVGIGIIALYLTLLVTVTFYMRKRIGMKTFRMIHLSSFASYFGAAVHGLMAGTDSVLLSARLMYAGTTLVIVFLTVYWVAAQMVSKQGPVRTRA